MSSGETNRAMEMRPLVAMSHSVAGLTFPETIAAMLLLRSRDRDVATRGSIRGHHRARWSGSGLRRRPASSSDDAPMMRAHNPHADRSEDPAAVPEDTLRMPVLQLDSLLGRARDEEEPVFLLVRRRAPSSPPMIRRINPSVSILLFVALVLGTGLLYLLR